MPRLADLRSNVTHYDGPEKSAMPAVTLMIYCATRRHVPGMCLLNDQRVLPARHLHGTVLHEKL